jgi:error-prone DNA polymerase
MFMTIEDETGVANVVIWEKVFEQYRRVVLGSGMIGIKGRIQREGEVVHVVARELFDLSTDLASIGVREAGFSMPHGRGDEFHHGSPGPDPRGLPKTRNLGSGYGHISEISVKARDFR